MREPTEADLKLLKVIEQAERAQRNFTAAQYAMRALIYSPASQERPIADLIEACWRLVEVQTYIENSRLELMLKEQAIKRAIGKIMQEYVLEKEPNVNAHGRRAPPCENLAKDL